MTQPPVFQKLCPGDKIHFYLQNKTHQFINHEGKKNPNILWIGKHTTYSPAQEKKSQLEIYWILNQ